MLPRRYHLPILLASLTVIFRQHAPLTPLDLSHWASICTRRALPQRPHLKNMVSIVMQIICIRDMPASKEDADHDDMGIRLVRCVKRLRQRSSVRIISPLERLRMGTLAGEDVVPIETTHRSFPWLVLESPESN